MKIKENAHINKYLGYARELKKQWNMKVLVVPIVVGALGDTQRPGKEIRERIGTIKTTARILRKVRESRGDNQFDEKPAVKSGVKMSHQVKIINAEKLSGILW